MDNIVDVKLGQSIPPERWLEAAEDLEKVFQMVAQHLLVTNHEGMGQQDAEEFMSDAVLALVAANPEGCRFIPIPSKGGDK